MQDRIKVVIVDDEPQSIHRLQDDLATLEDFEVIATSSSAVSAKNLVMSIQPDVLFINVEMPGQTGFEVLQSLRDEIPMDLIVVFYSAFDKYMIDALRASAFDFLLKPYQQDEFELVVDRIRQKMKDGDDVDEDASSVPESSSCFLNQSWLLRRLRIFGNEWDAGNSSQASCHSDHFGFIDVEAR